MNSPKAVAFTQKWVDLARSAGPTSWTPYEYPDCTRDLGDGVAMMVYDADSATYPKNKPGASAQAGNLAWHPGPAGPRRQLRDQPVDLVAGHELRVEEQAGGVAVHPVGHRQGGPGQGDRPAAFADPTRKSVFDGSFKQTLGAFPGYLETFEKVIDSTKIQFTPQKSSSRPPRTGRSRSRTSTRASPKARLDALAKTASTQDQL